MKNKEKLSLIYKILIVIVCTIGLIINIYVAPGKEMFLYFTILSNLACLIFYAVIVVLYFMKKLKKNNLYYIFKGMVTMSITLTFIVYQLFLSDSNDFYKEHYIANYFVHLITPLMIIFDYILFGEKGNLKKEYPIIWSSSLIAYSLFCFVYSMLGGRFLNGDKYPYFYMDVDKSGAIPVFINCMMIYFGFIGYGYLICYLDEKLKNRKVEK